mgnify:CR=1 FL=1
MSDAPSGVCGLTVVPDASIDLSRRWTASALSEPSWLRNPCFSAGVMSFGMGFFQHVSEVIRRHVAEQIQACFFQKLHDVVMDVPPSRMFREVEDALSPVVVVFGR